MLTALIKPTFKPYSVVAAEYYDAKRHPTCRNFRDASKIFLESILAGSDRGGVTVEVGAGDALVGEITEAGRMPFESLILLDSSSDMLAYSKRYRRMAKLIVGDARSLPFTSHEVSLIVASLTDPFNCPLFWEEARRSLKFGGRIVFTIPSHDWASSFRFTSEHECNDAALFQLASGEFAYVPSFIRSETEQISMLSSIGLRVLRVSHITADAIPLPHSAKIRGSKNIVTGYIAEAT